MGSNTITVEVRPQDGGTSKIYAITVIRAEKISSNALLDLIQLTSGKLMLAFFRGTIDYTANVTNDVSSVTVESYLSDSYSTVKVNGKHTIFSQ